MVLAGFHVSPFLDRDEGQEGRVEPDKNAEDDGCNLQLSNSIDHGLAFAGEHVKRIANNGSVARARNFGLPVRKQASNSCKDYGDKENDDNECISDDIQQNGEALLSHEGVDD